MKPGSAVHAWHVPAIAAAGAALVASWIAHARVSRATAAVFDDLPVHEDVATKARDVPPYLTGDLDGDGVPEIVLRVEGSTGAQLAVLGRDGAAYDELGRVPLEPAPGGCAASFTLEDGALLVTDYERTPWAEAACAPSRRTYYRVHDGRLACVGLVDEEGGESWAAGGR